MEWFFPLEHCPGIPLNYHPGAFGFHRTRKHGDFSTHTGVDLYAKHGDLVYTVEAGTVVGVEPFTGPQDDSPWWQDTDAVLIEGKSGVVCYGEVTSNVEIGDKVSRGDVVAFVSTVLPEGRERPDIPGHSRSMLHMELYDRGSKASTSWEQGRRSLGMRDPTVHLLRSEGCPEILTWQRRCEA